MVGSDIKRQRVNLFIANYKGLFRNKTFDPSKDIFYYKTFPL